LEEALKKKDEVIEREKKKLNALIEKIKLVRGGGKIHGGDISIKEFMN
jgi:hypothetical protein